MTSAAPARAAVALGANLGDRAALIRAAAHSLARTPGVRLLALSALRETAAVTLPGAPPQPPYLNAAALIDTTLVPRALLSALLDIEHALGRDRAPGERWAPRTIDLDLLLYGDSIIDEPGLDVPHPRLRERLFVLDPLAEIAPGLRHPGIGATIAALRDAARARDAGFTIRPEAPADRPAIFAVHAAAFPTDDEARLVDRVRAAGDAIVSLVAEQGSAVVGHALFSPVRADRAPEPGAGLAPVATLPAFQRKGVASALVLDGLAALRARSIAWAAVLGEPGYYARFGFTPASQWGLSCVYTGADAFMAMPLREGGLPRGGGVVRYCPAFG